MASIGKSVRRYEADLMIFGLVAGIFNPMGKRQLACRQDTALQKHSKKVLADEANALLQKALMQQLYVLLQRDGHSRLLSDTMRNALCRF